MSGGLKRELRKWYVKFERLHNRMRVLGEELANSSLTHQEKKEVWDFFGTFTDGFMTDLGEKYDLFEPFPRCLNCREMLDLPFHHLEKVITCKKCNTKMRLQYDVARLRRINQTSQRRVT